MGAVSRGGTFLSLVTRSSECVGVKGCIRGVSSALCPPRSSYDMLNREDGGVLDRWGEYLVIEVESVD